MRLSRFLILPQVTGIVHLFWRCHNKESLLNHQGAKELYLKSLKRGLKHRNSDGSVLLHAICLMGNHLHQLMSYHNGANKLSQFMRITNGIFGQALNKRFKRSGKVANERPKTPVIGNEASQMRVHFYIEANPLRSGSITLEALSLIPWNSYGYYAYGRVNEWTELLTQPSWYIALGKTPAERQRAYRRLFQEYVKGAPKKSPEFLLRFIGNTAWIADQQHRLKKILAERFAPLQARAMPG